MVCSTDRKWLWAALGVGAKVGANVHSHQATSGDSQPCVAAVQRHIGRHQATSGDRVELIWEQEAAGSNPAIPTKPNTQVVGLPSAVGTTPKIV